MIPTWKEINDPDFELPDEIEVRRSPVKLALRVVLAHGFLVVPLLLLLVGGILSFWAHERAFRFFTLGVFFLVVLSPLWGLMVYLDWAHCASKAPVFVLKRSGLFVRYINDGTTIPWSQIESKALEKSPDVVAVNLFLIVDPKEIRSVPPLGRWLGRKVLPSGLERRRLTIPLVYKLSASNMKALMRAYKKAAEKAGGSPVTSRTMVLGIRST
ncbi:hypothetical protein RHODOSMS8_02511 [Rhodobiaceae bacterium]|nr:hypothetical protein RHODOSMS8_02511 [Rhodobiaceae bacterium]